MDQEGDPVGAGVIGLMPGSTPVLSRSRGDVDINQTDQVRHDGVESLPRNLVNNLASPSFNLHSDLT